jgi:hypothetical protein
MLGGAVMNGERSKVVDLIADAHRVILALDDFAGRDGSLEIAIAVRNGLRVYAQLIDYRHTERMSADESSLLQSAIDLLRARLRFLGEVV